MKRYLFFLYGVASYAVFFVTFLYLICFLAPFEVPEVAGINLVPKQVDSGVAGPFWSAILINICLIALFGVPHTIMARIRFKMWWTKFVPAPIERSTYVLQSSAILIVLFWLWRPIAGTLWEVSNPVGYWLLTGMYFAGYLLVLYASFLIDHFDLFGLRQVYLYLVEREYKHPPFATPFLYSLIRHPLLAGWIIAFWATPVMTYGHLVFAIAATAYMLIAIPFEERGLMEILGEDYRQYLAQTPRLIPWPKRAK